MRAALAVLLALALLPLAGCLDPEAAITMPAGSLATSVAPADPWAAGSWWAYHATFRSGRSIDVALVVHEATPEGFRLGTNLSAGFFGLPFNGTVSPGYNPRIADEEWRLFDFPLAHGKTWDFTLLGYPVRTTARATNVEMPDGHRVSGFEMTSTSYGRTFARYTWAEEAGWFTRLALYEPTDGTRVLDVGLTARGEAFAAGYFVEVPLAKIRHEYPALDGADTLEVPPGAKIAATLSLRGDLGQFRASLLSPRGMRVAEVKVSGTGTALERATFTGTPGEWRLEHLGLGQGELRLELTTVIRAGTGDEPPEGIEPEPIHLARLLAPPATAVAPFLR